MVKLSSAVRIFRNFARASVKLESELVVGGVGALLCIWEQGGNKRHQLLTSGRQRSCRST